jgi:lipoprotein NlpI
MKTVPTHLLYLLPIALALASPAAFAIEEDNAALTQQAIVAAQKRDYPQALSLATRAIKAAPKQTRGWFVRAQIYDLQREHAKAVADYSEVLKLEPASPNAWQRRGEAHFRWGKINESIADFDKFLSLVPDQKPHHWQRGISLYYAGRFAEGKQQFELHQTVNTQDVENAVWHFLCTTRAENLDTAKKQLIPIEKDPRVPMAQVHQLFAGKATPKDVLSAAQAASSKTRAGEPLFYAHLYLGLYYEALGDTKKAGEYIRKAAERSKENGYMGDVAQVHADILKKKPKRDTLPSGERKRTLSLLSGH